MSEPAPALTPSPDFVQARWPLLIAGICTLAAMTALVSMPGAHFGLIYAIATAWSCWAIHAYAKGKRFHVSPGLYAAADDSQRRRRIMLGISICMHLGFTALLIGRLFTQGS
ncbi:MAG: hypothetical protein LBJ15_20170 [Comamonas sp.]|jgi:hypothetical protein|uniref:hypothetical protein n=1 Tax=Comamonas sp. TaxID=34028 RepID=UPI00281743C9|nr:hypothetical protein [Comamonas sp.]MDR0216294.1 hypothetical protein [Comamonas sp.]